MSDLIYYDNENNKDSMYRTINLYCFQDSSIGWKAKGLLCYLMTRPKKWKIWHKDIRSRSSNGEMSIRSGINELIQYKYIHRGKIYVDGKIKHWIHIVFSEPCNSISIKTKNKIEKLFNGNLFVQNLKVENQVYSKSNIRNNNNGMLSKDNSMRLQKKMVNKTKIKDDISFSDENESSVLKKPSAFNQNTYQFKNDFKNNLLNKNNPLNKNIFSERMIIFWNKQQNVSKHKKPTILKKIKDLINTLRKGLFKNKYHLDKRFLKDFHIPEKLLAKKFSKQEIKETILKMTLCHLSEYTPINKQFLSRSLADMIYHLPYKGKGRYNSTSYFFSCFVKAPELIEEQLPELSEQEKKLLECFREEVRERKINELRNIPEKDISYLLIRLYRFWKKEIVDEDNKPKHVDFSEYKYFKNSLVSNKFGTSYDMLRTYFDWIEENDWLNKTVHLFNVRNKPFQEFLKYEGNELNYNLTGKLTLNDDT